MTLRQKGLIFAFMAFLRTDKKKSGTYLRVVKSYKVAGKTRHKTLHSLGKVEDYTPEQLERIARKLVELAGRRVEESKMRNIFLLDESFLTRILAVFKEKMMKYNKKRYSSLD